MPCSSSTDFHPVRLFLYDGGLENPVKCQVFKQVYAQVLLEPPGDVPGGIVNHPCKIVQAQLLPEMGLYKFRDFYIVRCFGYRNLALMSRLEAIAGSRNISTAALPLAWVLNKGDDIVPIPGTRKIPYLQENIRAVDIRLTRDEMSAVESVFHSNAVCGERYSPEGMKGVNV